MERLNYRKITMLAEWQHLVEHLRSMKMDLVGDMITASCGDEPGKAAYLGGQIDMIDALIDLPRKFIAESNDATNAER
jgi:hypothetical protein